MAVSEEGNRGVIMSRRRKERDAYRAAKEDSPLITTGREGRAAACKGAAPVRGVMDAYCRATAATDLKGGIGRSAKAERRHSSITFYRAIAN